MGITLKGLTWDHPRGYAPLLGGISEYEEQNPKIKIQWDRRTLREFGESPIEQYLALYDLLIVDHPFVGFAAAHGNPTGTGAVFGLSPSMPQRKLHRIGLICYERCLPLFPTLSTLFCNWERERATRENTSWYLRVRRMQSVFSSP